MSEWCVQIMAVRERVKRHVVKRTGDLYQEITGEINSVKRLLDGVKRVPESSPVLPPRAAQAFRAGHLSYRLEMTWEVLQRVQVRVASSGLFQSIWRFSTCYLHHDHSCDSDSTFLLSARR